MRVPFEAYYYIINIGSSWGWGYGEHGLGINGHANV